MLKAWVLVALFVNSYLQGCYMGLFFWKNNKLIDDFANNIANELFSEVQPGMIDSYTRKSGNDKKSRKQNKEVEKRLMNTARQIKQFCSAHSLRAYGKARVLMKFSARLEELGYDASLTKQINEVLMTKI